MGIFSSFHWLDIVILVFVGWFGFKGLKNGLIKELVSIIALILGIWATVKFSNVVASWLGDSQLIRSAAFILIFLIVLVLVYFVGKLVESIVKIVLPSLLNHLFGLLFGVGKVVIVFSVFFYCIQKIDSKEILLKPEFKKQSLTYRYIEPVFPACKGWVSENGNTNLTD